MMKFACFENTVKALCSTWSKPQAECSKTEQLGFPSSWIHCRVFCTLSLTRGQHGVQAQRHQGGRRPDRGGDEWWACSPKPAYRHDKCARGTPVGNLRRLQGVRRTAHRRKQVRTDRSVARAHVNINRALGGPSPGPLLLSARMMNSFCFLLLPPLSARHVLFSFLVKITSIPPPPSHRMFLHATAGGDLPSPPLLPLPVCPAGPQACFFPRKCCIIFFGGGGCVVRIREGSSASPSGKSACLAP